MIETIGGIDVTAPLFGGMHRATLRDMVKLLSDASYHFADDSANEWGRGREKMRWFAEAANTNRLCYAAIVALHRDQPQLVTLDQVIDAVLKESRE